MFLLKTVFFLSFLVLIIPSGKEASTTERGGISRIELLSAGRDVWNDVSAFCDRNPETCETGNRLLAEFGAKARKGAKMLSVYLDAHSGRDRTG